MPIAWLMKNAFLRVEGALMGKWFLGAVFKKRVFLTLFISCFCLYASPWLFQKVKTYPLFFGKKVAYFGTDFYFRSNQNGFVKKKRGVFDPKKPITCMDLFLFFIFWKKIKSLIIWLCFWRFFSKKGLFSGFFLQIERNTVLGPFFVFFVFFRKKKTRQREKQ